MKGRLVPGAPNSSQLPGKRPQKTQKPKAEMQKLEQKKIYLVLG